MKTATVAELHEHLDEYLDAVRSGQAVEIRDDKGSVAQLMPPLEQPQLPPEFEQLIKAGVASAPLNYKPLPADFLTRPRLQFRAGSTLVCLLEEREEGW